MSFVAEDTPVQPSSQSFQAFNLPEGVPLLTTLYLYISGACNLACRHCWITPAFQPNGRGDQYIKFEHVRKVIYEAKSLGLSSVKLTGGEPTLHPQFDELLAFIHEQGISSNVETNGTLVDDRLAEYLKMNGVWFVSVSIDGAKRETHEALRAVVGSYDRAINGIKALVRVGYPVQIICTLHRGNVAEIEDIVALGEDLGCGSVKFNTVQRIGRGAHFADDNGLEIPEIIDLYHHIENTIQPGRNITIQYDIPMAFLSIQKVLSGVPRCSFQNIMGVLASGELSLCGIGVTVPELIYGHIDNCTLREVWYNNPCLISIREQIPSQIDGICGQCIHRNFCQGHCVAHNFYSAGRLNAPLRFCEQADALGLFPISRKRFL